MPAHKFDKDTLELLSNKIVIECTKVLFKGFKMLTMENLWDYDDKLVLREYKRLKAYYDAKSWLLDDYDSDKYFDNITGAEWFDICLEMYNNGYEINLQSIDLV